MSLRKDGHGQDMTPPKMARHNRRSGFHRCLAEIVLLSALLSLATSTACLPKGGTAAARARSGDEELAVRRGVFSLPVLLTGELVAVDAVEIPTPRTPQWELTIHWLAEDGARVKAGDRLVAFDTSAFAANLENRRLSLARAEAEQAQHRASAAGRITAQQQELEARRIALEKAIINASVPAELISRREYEERRLALLRARAEHDRARDELASLEVAIAAESRERKVQVAQSRAEILRAEEAIAAVTIAAPRGGIVEVATHPWEGRKLQVGDTAWPGLVTVRLPALESMAVEAALYDVDDGAVAPGTRAHCALDAYPERRFPARVIAITPVAQEPARLSRRRTFRVILELDEPDPEIMRPGMSVRAEVTALTLDDVLVAPRSALDLDGAATRARLVGGRWRQVELGPCSAQECQVLGGLADGERLARRDL